MYAVVYKGEVKGFCDTPNYIVVKNGIYTNPRPGQEGEGVAIGGVAYLFKDGVILKKVDSGEVAFNEGVEIEKLSVDLADTEDALCETSVDLETRIADIEDALCELSES